MTRVVLWGEDHTELGRRHFEPVSPSLALGVTRGERKKRYSYVDPNEDAVAAVVGPRATLLVCADGHNGFVATRAAVEAALAAFGDDPPPADLSDAELVTAWHGINDAVFRAASGSLQPQSRTTLVVALVVPGMRLQWASMGDSLLAVCNDAVTVPGERRNHFVGWPMEERQVDARLLRGDLALDAGDWVILASDGFADFVDDPIVAVAAAVGDGTREAVVVAENLVAQACDGGAGDNVAVAVMRA